MDLTPSYVTELFELGFMEPDAYRPAVLGVGGEATPADVWEQLCAVEGMTMHDLYGPTEFTVDAYAWHGPVGDRLPGRVRSRTARPRCSMHDSSQSVWVFRGSCT